MLKKIQILGISAGIPTKNRGTSCTIISTTKYHIMIDCGEGSYLRWKNAKYKWENLKYIIITHLHADHIGGLISLLFYRKIYGIKQTLTLIGPTTLKKYILEYFKISQTEHKQTLIWKDISVDNNLILDDNIYLKSLPMKHKIPCWGYQLKDKNKKIVFVTDTLPNSNTIELAENCDILIHEATFLHKMDEISKKCFHTTVDQAMKIAQKSNVKQLILTHFDPSITDKELNQFTWNNKRCVIFDKKILL